MNMYLNIVAVILQAALSCPGLYIPDDANVFNGARYECG